MDFFFPFYEDTPTKEKRNKCCRFFFFSIGVSLTMYLSGGFKYLLFSPLFGEDSHFD